MQNKSILSLLFVFLVTFFLQAQIPTAYYSAAEGKTDASLKTQLSSIISAGYVDKGYDGLYDVYKTSDNLPSGKVWDMYSIKADGTAAYFYTHDSDKCGSYAAEASCYNREHTFCDSWLGAASPQRSDAHHLIPTDGYVNNRRSSFPHGKVVSASWTSTNGSKLGSSDPSTGYSGTVFEPIDEFKGDFARMYFYVATRYESKIAGWAGNGSAGEILAGNTYPAYKTWFYTLLLQWNKQDPVSQKEINRNNAIATFQKNRNPYIDYPELANYIWGDRKGQQWYINGGTNSYLSSPLTGSVVDFGKVSFHQSVSTTIQIKASNLTGDLTLALGGNNANNFSISEATLTKNQAEQGYTLTLTYNANTIGIQSALLTISGGGISATQVSLISEATDGFMALPATNITSTGFDANWTSSANATGYTLNVFTLQNSGTSQSQTLIDEAFTSGLPSNWTSSGYINGTELAGFVRLGSSSTNGVITTPIINLSTPVTVIVKAKQYVNDAAAKLTIKVNTDSISNFITTNTSADYTINIPQKTAASTITFSATGGSGKRVYIDNVKVSTQGITQTPVAVTGFPMSVGNLLTFKITGLESDSTYYYTVKHEGNTTEVSDKISIRTLLYNSIIDKNDIDLSWRISRDGISIQKTPINCIITLYDAFGRKLKSFESNNSTSDVGIPIQNHGVYLLQIAQNHKLKTVKIIF
jgi:endonuclease I